MKKSLISILGVAALLAACGNGATTNTSSTTGSGDQVKVIASFYPMYDFTKNIVGDEGEVSLLIGSGVEAHGYEPSAKDMAIIQEADAFVYNNENMETWVPKLESTIDKDKVKMIKATEGMVLLPGSDEEEHDHDHSGEGHSHELDPHVWLAPSLAIKEVESIRDQLVTAFPAKKEAFEANAKAYITKLTALDETYKKELSVAKQKTFVTQHAAFSYLALEYGLTQVPISGISPDVEPSPSRLAELTTFVKENDIKNIYFEANASAKIAETLSKETGVQLLVLNPLESLTKEQMDKGEDYISVMNENLAALLKTTNTENNSPLAQTTKVTEKTIYNGYFEDVDIQDRPLTDWAGEWQSVYPYLVDGTLDQVFDYKSKKDSSKTALEYKEYYTIGYKTDVDKITITADTMEFFVNGQGHKATYKYAGKHVLTYSKGNRGVRYLFEATEDIPGAYKYVQFSDHSIFPTKAGHFHIYFGNESQAALLEELENWPTYYPANLNGLEIAQEMVAH